MECDICMLEWNTDTRIPRLLQCGHTFCQTCLLSLLSSSQNKGTDFFCPNCMAKHKEIRSESAILSLIKNFHLLRIAEKIEIRKTIIKNSIDESKLDESMMSTISNRKKIKLHPYDNSEYKESNAGTGKNDEANNNYFSNPKSNIVKPDKDDSKVFEKKLTLFKQIEVNDLNAKCKKHNQSFNSYVTGTNILFCNKCIEESNMEVCPLPSIIKEYKKKIDSSKLNICLISNEIRRLYDFFESYQEEFDKSNKQKIDDLFAYYYKIISFNYNTAIQIFSQCKGEQKTQIEHKINELKLLEEELYEFNEDLSRINSIEDYKILKEDGKIEEIYERLNNFINYDSELSLLTMKVGVKNEFKNSIFNTIQESYYLDVEFASIQGETPTLKHILQKEKFWICICGELNNPISQISCFSCDRFRRFETILNFYSHPENVSPEEMRLFQVRRKAEGRIFQDLIKENENLKKEGSLFYVIDLEWFLLWKCYVTNDSSDKNLPNSKKKFSVNKEIGVLPPGPISNGNLFYKANQFDEKTLRKGLSKNDEYVIVNIKVWNLFFSNYNGGPEIILRKNDDIYLDFKSCGNFDCISYFDCIQVTTDSDEEEGEGEQKEKESNLKIKQSQVNVVNNTKTGSFLENDNFLLKNKAKVKSTQQSSSSLINYDDKNTLSQVSGVGMKKINDINKK